jgi:hypothetical protein
VLNPGELAVLEQACRTADELDRLDKAVRALPDLVVSGSMGQPRMHPLLNEARGHRLLLERLVGALALPDEYEESGLRPGQRHAQRAANARWRPKVPTENGKLAELRAAAGQGGW